MESNDTGAGNNDCDSGNDCTDNGIGQTVIVNKAERENSGLFSTFKKGLDELFGEINN